MAAGHYEALALQRPMLAPYESIHEARYLLGAATVRTILSSSDMAAPSFEVVLFFQAQKEGETVGFGVAHQLTGLS